MTQRHEESACPVKGRASGATKQGKGPTVSGKGPSPVDLAFLQGQRFARAFMERRLERGEVQVAGQKYEIIRKSEVPIRSTAHRSPWPPIFEMLGFEEAIRLCFLTRIEATRRAMAIRSAVYRSAKGYAVHFSTMRNKKGFDLYLWKEKVDA